MKEQLDKKIKLKVLFTLILTMLIVAVTPCSTTMAAEADKGYVYLSDIPYVASQSKVSYSTILSDKTCDNTALSLRVNDTNVTFKKGVFAHATSTVVYDLTDYKDYAYFTTYYGVCSQKGTNGSVKFYIYTSTDGTNWTLQTEENPIVMTGSTNAKFVKIDIRDAKYLKLYAYDNGGNGQDHSLYGDAKLMKEGVSDQLFPSLEEYNKLIKDKYEKNNGQMDDSLELLVLQRDFIKNVGEYQIKYYMQDAEENGKLDEATEAFNWLFYNLDILRLYTAGGKPDGSYQKSLQVLQELYTTYKADLTAEGTTKNGTALKDVYTRMVITLSLTHSQNILFWVSSSNAAGVSVNPNLSVAVKRYGIYKEMLVQDKLHPNFEKLKVEEMRAVMNTQLGDDEILWLRDYIIGSGKNWRSSYQFMSYKNVNTGLYRSDQFYGENRENWNAKFKLEGYDMANVKYFPKTFMVMQIGGVCWQISNVGQTMCASYGIPSILVGQPGHLAYLVGEKDAKGNSTWSIWNNVSGWQQSNLSGYNGTRGYYTVRLLNGWGNGSYCSGYSGSYVVMASKALDDYDNYVKAKAKVLLADSFANMGDIEKADKLYQEAIEIQKINLDAYISWINLRTGDKNGVLGNYEQNLYEIAEVAAQNLKYYPLPMYDVLRLISNKIENTAYKSVIAMLEKQTLTEAKSATAANVVQADICKTMANYLLGSLNFDVATFTFDGEEGATLSLASIYASARPNWDFSLDNGKSWIDAQDATKFVLTEEQVQKITAENDILVHFIGVTHDTKNLYRIDIKEATALPSTLYPNDLENKFIDAVDTMEYRFNENEAWTSFKKQKPDLSGDKEVYVRMGANGVYLPGASKKYTFTDNGDDKTKSYVTIDHLSVHEFSSETVRTGNQEHAKNCINGNLYTFWHTSRTSTTDERYIVIKLDEPRYISKIEYVPVQNYDYGVLKNGIISTSIDGTNWTESYTIENLPKSNETKSFDFETPVYTQYIKIKCNKSYDYLKNSTADWFLSVAMFNFFEDLTITIPTAEVKYSQMEKTAIPVVATLTNASTDITVTNNDGESYTFNENGTFIFKFKDAKGNQGSAIAKVDWMVDYSFAFDGENANSIIVAEKYKDKAWQYSIDGGNTWKDAGGKKYTLTEEELQAVSADKDIKIRIPDGENYIEHTFDILPAANIPTTLYPNDLENAVIGATKEMEWKIEGQTSWTSFNDQAPDLAGDKVVYVRMAGHDLTLAGSDIKQYTFTKDSEDLTRKYISVQDITVEKYSSQGVRPERNEFEYATNAVDGNANTVWHTDHTTGTDEKYIILSLATPKYLSALEVVPKQNYNYGITRNAIVEVSMDGENWTQVSSITNAPYNYETRVFEFEEQILAQYVKFQCTKSYDDVASGKKDANYFVNATMINLYCNEALENKEIEVTISYDIQTSTNKDVTATVYVDNGKIKITNNDGKFTHVFKDNGEFTFEYVDENGNEGSITATVSWIDKKAPEATVTYSEEHLTNKDVKATITFNEEVEILTKNVTLKYVSGNTYEYTFEENGEFTLEFKDINGNVGSKNIKVDNIDKTKPTATITYDITSETEQNVTATLVPSEDIIVTNNKASMSHTFEKNGKFVFEFMDKAGNTNTAEAEVSWIVRNDPLATIKCAENNWTVLLNKITFGIFFKDTAEITIEKNDEDVAKIEYYVANNQIEQEELENITEWIDYEDKFTINPNNQYVIYAKITTNDSKVTYISSDGIVLENRLPQITGIVEGETYCLSRKVTVNDEYIYQVTVDGVIVELDEDNSFMLKGKDTEQTIIATDKAGNSATVKVTVKPEHTYEFVNFEWDETNYTAKVNLKCIVDNVTKKVDAQVTKEVVREATISQEGEIKYTAKYDGRTDIKTVSTPKLVGADYSKVTLAKNNASKIDRNIYTADSLSALDEALNAIIEDLPKSQQTVVDWFAENIENALAKLEEKEANYINVTTLVKEVEKMKLDNYTDESVNNLKSEIAKIDYTLKITSQSTVDGYVSSIQNAINALVEKDADYTKVNSIITKVKAMDLTIYTEETVNALNAEIAKVDTTLKISKQSIVDGYENAIQAALDKLEELKADYTNVNSELAKVNSIDLNKYTDETVRKLKEVIANINFNLGITKQSVVDSYVTSIESAINSLVIKRGEINAHTKKDENALDINITSDVMHLEEVLLTAAEKAKLDAGEHASVYIKVQDISTTISDDEKELIKEQTKDSECEYMDISLFKEVGSSDAVKITNPSEKITLSVIVPEHMKNTNNDIKRTYYIVRIHNGVAEMIDGKYNSKTSEFTFETDKFSTYALSYKDSKVTPGSVIDDIKDAIANPDTGVEIQMPTRYYFYLIIPFMVIVLSAIAVKKFAK